MSGLHILRISNETVIHSVGEGSPAYQAGIMANNRRKQYEELFETIESQRKVYLQKRKDYTESKETIDNLIDSRTQLVQTQLSLTHSLEGFYSSIFRLDHACGVYFTKLGINLEGVDNKESTAETIFSSPFK